MSFYIIYIRDKILVYLVSYERLTQVISPNTMILATDIELSILHPK